MVAGEGVLRVVVGEEAHLVVAGEGAHPVVAGVLLLHHLVEGVLRVVEGVGVHQGGTIAEQAKAVD